VVFSLFRRWRRKRLRARPVPAAWAEILARNAPFVARLSEADRARLLGDVAVLVAEKVFLGAGGLAVDDEHRVTIAAAAARLVLRLDVGLYDDLTEIIVYPDAYQHAGADGAVFGEAHTWGVVVLSWQAVIQGMRDQKDGHDTALHEFAHVLDRVDGAFDGAPGLRAREDYRPWAAVMSRHYQKLVARDRTVRSVLRDYGATNEAEFFAVATEAFFERPAKLRERAPALYDELRRFYGGDR
jgi:Mlc titration factor MtfA (ptsG expression regulator)